MLIAQAVNRATTSILCIAGSENRARSMNETHVKSPKFVFSRIHISFTQCGAILGRRPAGA